VFFRRARGNFFNGCLFFKKKAHRSGLLSAQDRYSKVRVSLQSTRRARLIVDEIVVISAYKVLTAVAHSNTVSCDGSV